MLTFIRSSAATFTLMVEMLLAACICLAGSVDTVSSFRVGVDLRGHRIPVWNQSGLLILTGGNTQHPSFTVSDTNGGVVSTVAITIPGASLVSVNDYTRGGDGSIAFCGAVADQDGRGTPYVATVSPDGQSLIVTRTGSYYAHKITIATDGSVWTIGYAYLATDNKKLDPDASMLRTWTRDLKMTKALLPQSLLQAPRSAALDNTPLRAGGNRIGWFARTEGKYFEVDASGILTTIANLNIPVNNMIRGMAVTDSGRVFLSYGNADGSWSVAELDRGNSTWTAIIDSSREPDPVVIWGANGEQLVGKRERSNAEGKLFRVNR